MSDTENQPLNIHQRINEVRKVVQYAQKDKTVQTYKAVSHDAVVALLHDAVVQHGILIYPEQVVGKLHDVTFSTTESGAQKRDSMRMYEGGYLIRFINIDNPQDFINVPIEAHAQDNGDKAPGKAVTYATKAAMLKIFFLETGENEESRVSSTRPITPEQAQMIRKKLGDDPERIEKFCAAYWIEAVEELAKSDFNEAAAKIDKANAALKEKK